MTVKNCQKALFFVPKEGEIGDSDGQLAQLEEDAAADPSKKGELLKYVHVRLFLPTFQPSSPLLFVQA